jgi:hypothetical protein
MDNQSNAKADPPPPRGMIEIDGRWEIRRFGLVVQRRLTCIFGHRIVLGLRPFEVAAPCGFKDNRDSQIACDAQLYLFSTRARLIWAMDVTPGEAEMIERREMDTPEIIAFFGAGFPSDIKILRKSKP